MLKIITLLLKITIPILVLVGAVFFGKVLIETGPKAKKRPFVQSMPVVEVATLKAESYTVHIEASGIVRAGTQSNLVSEIPGRIIKISDNFSEGSYFNKDEVLLEIDQSDYISAIDIAKSNVLVNDANLKQIVAEEKSNLNSVKLAQKNLAIGNKELARLRSLFKRQAISRSALDTEEQRINQLKQTLQNLKGAQSTFASRKSAMQAQIKSGQSRVKQEKLRLSRTSIKAPYAGRVLSKNVDRGQFVSAGTTLASIYATDFVDVELPLSLNQYELLGVPEAFRNKSISISDLPTATLTNPDSIKNDIWQGKVVRTSAALDAQSRQINVIVKVDDPYVAREGISSPIRIGQFLKASLEGRTFKNVYVLPPVSVIYNREIRLLKDGKINIVPVDVIWNSSSETVIKTDENIEGQQIILTNLSQAVNGMAVLTVAQQKEQNKQKAMKRKNSEEAKSKQKEQAKLEDQKQEKSKTAPNVVYKDTTESNSNRSDKSNTDKVTQ